MFESYNFFASLRCLDSAALSLHFVTLRACKQEFKGKLFTMFATSFKPDVIRNSKNIFLEKTIILIGPSESREFI